jgi:hypothetical protein
MIYLVPLAQRFGSIVVNSEVGKLIAHIDLLQGKKANAQDESRDKKSAHEAIVPQPFFKS